MFDVKSGKDGAPNPAGGLKEPAGAGPATLVFVHGWAFDTQFWQPLRRALSDWPQHVIDLGYFPSEEGNGKVAPLPAGPLVMVGHSFGYLHALSLDCSQIVAWVSINGFPCFGTKSDFPEGVADRILQRMRARLEALPEKVVNEFRQRCGAKPVAAHMDVAALSRDLLRMQNVDLRSRMAERKRATLVLAGDADPIVSTCMTRAAFAGADIVWRPGAGHLLPREDAAWCAAQLSGFLAQRGRAMPDTASAHFSNGKRRIAARFGAAADSYERQAVVQRTAAKRLARKIAGFDLPRAPRILELGCGTGLFTRELSAHIGPAQWFITDIAQAMLNTTRQGVKLSGTSHFRLLDGEYPVQQADDRWMPAEGFDLICSNMAVQWFDDLNAGLGRLLDLLAPGGYLVLSTLVAGTFAQWRDAHIALGLQPATLMFPSPDTLGASLPAQCIQESSIEVEHLVQDCGTALAFLRGLKAIGATVPASGATPLTAAQLRQVCQAFELSGAQASYEIAFCVWRRR